MICIRVIHYFKPSSSCLSVIPLFQQLVGSGVFIASDSTLLLSFARIEIEDVILLSIQRSSHCLENGGRKIETRKEGINVNDGDIQVLNFETWLTAVTSVIRAKLLAGALGGKYGYSTQNYLDNVDNPLLSSSSLSSSTFNKTGSADGADTERRGISLGRAIIQTQLSVGSNSQLSSRRNKLDVLKVIQKKSKRNKKSRSKRHALNLDLNDGVSRLENEIEDGNDKSQVRDDYDDDFEMEDEDDDDSVNQNEHEFQDENHDENDNEWRRGSSSQAGLKKHLGDVNEGHTSDFHVPDHENEVDDNEGDGELENENGFYDSTIGRGRERENRGMTGSTLDFKNKDVKETWNKMLIRNSKSSDNLESGSKFSSVVLPPLRVQILKSKQAKKKMLLKNGFDEFISRPTPRCLKYENNLNQSYSTVGNLNGSNNSSNSNTLGLGLSHGSILRGTIRGTDNLPVLVDEASIKDTVDLLRKELAIAEAGVQYLNTKVEENILWVHSNCDMTSLNNTMSNKTINRCRGLSLDRLFLFYSGYIQTSLQNALKAWKAHTNYSKITEISKKYCRAKGIELFSKTLNSAITRQFLKGWTPWFDGVKKQKYQEIILASVLINRRIRGYLVRLRCQHIYNRRIKSEKEKKCSIMIQSTARKYLSKKMFIKKKESIAAKKIQKYFKSLVHVRKAKDELEFREKKRLVIKIQKNYRGMKGREKFIIKKKFIESDILLKNLEIQKLQLETAATAAAAEKKIQSKLRKDRMAAAIRQAAKDDALAASLNLFEVQELEKEKEKENEKYLALEREKESKMEEMKEKDRKNTELEDMRKVEAEAAAAAIKLEKIFIEENSSKNVLLKREEPDDVMKFTAAVSIQKMWRGSADRLLCRVLSQQRDEARARLLGVSSVGSVVPRSDAKVKDASKSSNFEENVPEIGGQGLGLGQGVGQGLGQGLGHGLGQGQGLGQGLGPINAVAARANGVVSTENKGENEVEKERIECDRHREGEKDEDESMFITANTNREVEVQVKDEMMEKSAILGQKVPENILQSDSPIENVPHEIVESLLDRIPDNATIEENVENQIQAATQDECVKNVGDEECSSELRAIPLVTSSLSDATNNDNGNGSISNENDIDDTKNNSNSIGVNLVRNADDDVINMLAPASVPSLSQGIGTIV